MNRLETARRVQVVKCLVEGNSLRATARMTGVARMTIEKLVRDLGKACAEYQDKTLTNLNCERVQVDEIWSFVYAERANVTERMADKHPDVWTWTAIDADTKLVLSWMVGSRDVVAASDFMKDIAARLAFRVQLTTDGHQAYLTAVDKAFGTSVEYAMLTKIFAANQTGRYSPPTCIGTKCNEVSGSPDLAHISTCFVERQNLTMRMHMRRLTRLTNAFSKKVEMHAHSVAIHFMWYNFARIHQTLRVTPAIGAGVTTRLWEAEDIVDLLP